MNLRKVLYECYNFVIDRKKLQGGFAATRLLPATVEDTYHALNIIKALKEFGLNIEYDPSKDNSLRQWIQENKSWNHPKVFYQFLKVCELCNIQIEEDIIKHYVKLLFSQIITLEKMFYLAKISEKINFQLPSIENLPISQTVKDLWMLIYLIDKKIVKEKIKDRILIEYFRECQNPDGGFGFGPNTTSYIDNTYYCIKALKFLGSEPKNPENLLNFILFCQTKSGGFARTPQASAFLDSTFYAIETLKILLIS